MATLPANMKLIGQDTASAQNIIKMPDLIFKYGLLRKRPKTLNIGRWPRRFIVLMKTEIRVYTDENSKSPRSTIPLQGYNGVKRIDVKGQEWAFSIHLANNSDQDKAKTFGCISDTERKDWMKAVKRQLYVANSMDVPDTTMVDKLRTICEEDKDEYRLLEQAIDINSDTLPEHHSSSDDDSSESGSGGGKSLRSFTIPRETAPSKATAGKFRKMSSSASFDYETPEKKESAKPLARSNSEKPPRPPPRYSEVMSGCPDYVNIPENDEMYEMPDDFAVHTLEALCTIHDDNPDRDELIRLLQAKQLPGTYLIRKSRKGDEKVLSFLTQDGSVKEFKMYHVASEWTLDHKKQFKDITELIRHYTHNEKLPNANIHLKKGFFTT